MQAQLQARLTPGPDNAKALAVILAKLFAAFPAQAQSDTPTEQRVDAYFEALGDVPAWAVEAVARAILRGETETDGRFMPTPPQLGALAREQLRSTHADLATVQRIMAAKPIGAETSAAERERVKEGFKRFQRELRGEDDETPADSGFLAMCAELGVDPNSIEDANPKGGLKKLRNAA